MAHSPHHHVTICWRPQNDHVKKLVVNTTWQEARDPLHRACMIPIRGPSHLTRRRRTSAPSGRPWRALTVWLARCRSVTTLEHKFPLAATTIRCFAARCAAIATRMLHDCHHDVPHNRCGTCGLPIIIIERSLPRRYRHRNNDRNTLMRIGNQRLSLRLSPSVVHRGAS